jgi:hypothetical protein
MFFKMTIYALSKINDFREHLMHYNVNPAETASL